MTVFQTLCEPLRLHRTRASERQAMSLRQEVETLLETVGLPHGAIDKYPHEFSGGQRQRIGIARAIATDPTLLIADEPVSSLDVSVQAQILNLLDDLCTQRQMTFFLISHDLKVIHHFCDRILVMYLGALVEELPAADLYTSASHPYTKALLDAIPPDSPGISTTQRNLLEGDVPSPIDLPSGCCFHTRCPLVEARCRIETPALREIGPGQKVACHLAKAST